MLDKVVSEKIGFIGTGDIAAPMIRYLARKGHTIIVSERSEALSKALAAEFEVVSRAPNQEVLDGSDVVFLCLRPEAWEAVVPGLSFREEQKIVSVMSRVSIADLERACAPASEISITIPMAAMEHGGCPLPVYPSSSPVGALFGSDNPVLPQHSEVAISAHFAASTMLSATLGAMHHGADWLSDQTGQPDLAETYVNALVQATLRDVPHEAGQLKAARDALATPGTLNEMMKEGLEAADMPRALATTLTNIKGTFA